MLNTGHSDGGSAYNATGGGFSLQEPVKGERPFGKTEYGRAQQHWENWSCDQSLGCSEEAVAEEEPKARAAEERGALPAGITEIPSQGGDCDVSADDRVEGSQVMATASS